MTKILFVCLANICRSPMAQRVTEALADARPAGLSMESAGVQVARSGVPPDPRALSALERRGYVGRRGRRSRSRSREVRADDFTRFDLILAMDHTVLDELTRQCPAGESHRLHLFLDFAEGLHGQDVPDPYFGGIQGFENVLDLCEAGARGLLSEIDLRTGP
jgi:protein-tyrosine phosphatase